MYRTLQRFALTRTSYRFSVCRCNFVARLLVSSFCFLGQTIPSSNNVSVLNIHSFRINFFRHPLIYTGLRTCSDFLFSIVPGLVQKQICLILWLTLDVLFLQISWNWMEAGCSFVFDKKMSILRLFREIVWNSVEFFVPSRNIFWVSSIFKCNAGKYKWWVYHFLIISIYFILHGSVTRYGPRTSCQRKGLRNTLSVEPTRA